jgi:tetratricopeptide (TPR) repeat protein
VTDPISDRYKDALRRGHVAVVQGRPREAVTHYQEAGRLAGHRPLPWVSMGSVFLRMHRPADALAAFDEALRRAPGDLSALRGKAEALAAAGRRDEANAVARRASELQAMENAGRRMGVVAAGDADVSFAEAEEARADEQDERAIAAYLAASAAYAQRDLPDAALDACYRALEVAPGSIAVHLAMADLYLRRGWREHGVERLELIEHVLRIDPDPDVGMQLVDLAAEHRTLDPALERIASSVR